MLHLISMGFSLTFDADCLKVWVACAVHVWVAVAWQLSGLACNEASCFPVVAATEGHHSQGLPSCQIYVTYTCLMANDVVLRRMSAAHQTCRNPCMQEVCTEKPFFAFPVDAMHAAASRFQQTVHHIRLGYIWIPGMSVLP